MNTTTTDNKAEQTEKRIRIAEAMGWKLVDLPLHPNGPKELWMTPEGKQLQLGTPDALPDYFNDLNAALTLVDHLAEFGWRCSLTNDMKTWECEFIGYFKDRWLIHRAAAEPLAGAICEAFLLTIAP